MSPLWRISNHEGLEGLGGERTDGRWHTAARGKRIVYLSEHPALALIEVLANLKGSAKLLPETYQLMKIGVGPDVAVETLAADGLTAGWAEDLKLTRTLGDAWLRSRSSALLAVPAVPSPESVNYLLNPLHAGAKGVTAEWCKWMTYDKRVFRADQAVRISTSSPSGPSR